MTAPQLAKTAIEIGQVADQIKPSTEDTYTGARNVIVYHLRVAARLARELAEALPK